MLKQLKSGNVVILFTIVRFADISIVPSFTINSTLSYFLDFECDAAKLLIVYMNHYNIAILGLHVTSSNSKIRN